MEEATEVIRDKSEDEPGVLIQCEDGTVLPHGKISAKLEPLSTFDAHPSLLLDSRSASNSPKTPRKYDFLEPFSPLSSSHLSSSSRLTCSHSQEDFKNLELDQLKYSTLPSLSRRSLSNADIANTLKVANSRQNKRLSKKTKVVSHPLHYPKSPEALVEFLEEGYDPNSLYHDDYLPIHTYISRQRKKKYVELLYILLSHSGAYVDCSTLNGTTALHIAVQEGSIHVIKLLLIFGAEVSLLNSMLLTPLDVAVQCGHEKAIALLQQLGAVQGDLAKHSFGASIPRLKSFYDTGKMKAQLAKLRQKHRNYANGANAAASQSVANGDVNGAQHGGTWDKVGTTLETVEEEDGRERLFSSQSLSHVTLRDMEDGNTLSTLYERLHQCINMTFDLSGSFSANTDEAIAITMQQKELLKFKKTEQERKPFSFNVNEGSRILFLDGGGMRGLIQIEILEQLEKKTGRKVTELFDWIVGTSTGGIVALGLVYAKKTLAQMRQLYFKMKDHVFGSDRFGFGYNTTSLEKILMKEFGTSMRFSDVTSTNVIVPAVYKKTTMPELHFFNNCFHDEFSDQLVWKVARYTSAAPMFFTEFEDYVDGGVLANNPCSYSFSAIQNFHRQLGEKLDIAVVVSVGCGVFPVEDLGKTDAQEFLYFGKHWLKAGHSIKARAKSLVTLLTTALVESESVARSFRSRMEEQGIPFYRFNPQLDEVIPSGETDLPKLMNMLIKTKTYMMNGQELGLSMLNELVQLLHLVAELNRKSIQTVNFASKIINQS